MMEEKGNYVNKIKHSYSFRPFSPPYTSCPSLPAFQNQKHFQENFLSSLLWFSFMPAYRFSAFILPSPFAFLLLLVILVQLYSFLRTGHSLPRGRPRAWLAAEPLLRAWCGTGVLSSTGAAGAVCGRGDSFRYPWQ